MIKHAKFGANLFVPVWHPVIKQLQRSYYHCNEPECTNVIPDYNIAVEQIQFHFVSKFICIISECFAFCIYADDSTLLVFCCVQLIGLIFIFIFAVFGLQFFGDRADV